MVQVALFSATISKDIEDLIKERFAPLQVVRLSPKEALRNIFFHYIVVDAGQKQRFLAGLIQHQRIRQALIFTPNRDEVYELAHFLRSMGHKAEAYHGLLDQVERAAIMKRFKQKQVNFLVATDLAARGLDVEA
jgi:superfamily II DNA/RNA helicase